MAPPSPQALLDAAEEKFKRNNNAERAFALANAARQIDHRFNGIDNIVAAYEIHYLAAVEKKPNGSVDWYAVLGLSSDTCPHIETVKKRYKKLALMVHPDKNSSAAAEGAFKLISEAVEAIISSPQAASRVKHKSNDSNKASTRRSSWTRKAKATPKTSTPSYSSSKSEDRLCVKCKRSPRSYNSIYCPYCVQSEPSRPVPPSSPKRAANSSNETGSTKKSNVKCPWCFRPCAYQSETEFESVSRCAECWP